MSTINQQDREISVKIVYYGPGLGGKTSTLQAIHGLLAPTSRGQLVSLATGADRTLYFDFLPVKARVGGFSVRLQLYTVPGQVHYNSTRKLVLSGADAVVFVADSQRGRYSANRESLVNLGDNLREQGRALDELPLVLQYNKRDAPDAVPPAELDALLERKRQPMYETVATKGIGVFDALKTVSKLTLAQLARSGATRQRPPVHTPPAGVPITPQARADTGDDSPLRQSLQHLAEKVTQMAPEAPRTGSGAYTMPHESAAAHSLAHLIMDTPLRASVGAVQSDIERSDWGAAVRHAGRGFHRLASELAGEAATSERETAAIAALTLGLPATWLSRFRETVGRVVGTGAVSPDDALFALLFLTAAAVRADEYRRT